MPIFWEDQELRPAPLVTISRRYIKSTRNTTDHLEYLITLNGTIVNVETEQDSPSATTEGMEGILSEQKRIREMFKEDGGRLQILSPPAGGPNAIDAYCIIDSVDFAQGTWVNRCDYTIVLRARSIAGEDQDYGELDSYTESWNITENDDGTFSISHQLSAKGALIYSDSGTNDPLSAARNWVYDRMYILNPDGTYSVRNASVLSGDFSINDLITGVANTNINFFNKSVVESVDPDTYSWSITENFIYNPSGKYREDWSASVNFEADNQNRVTVTINGSVYGFSDKASDHNERLNRAKDAFFSQIESNISTRLSVYLPENFVISPIASTKQYSFEPIGTVRYNYTFICFKNGTNLIAGAIDENIDIQDTGKTDVFAEIVIPGRAKGPIVQDIKTVTLPTRTVTITASMLPSVDITQSSLYASYLSKPNTDAIINALKPTAGYFYVTADQESWSPLKRQYSRSVSWTIHSEQQNVQGIPIGPRSKP